MTNIIKIAMMAGLTLLSVNIAFTQTKELSLKEALQVAAGGNRELQKQFLEKEKAANATKESRSYLLPTVTAASGFSVYGERPVIYLRNENSDIKLDDVKYGGRFVFDGNITATYPIANPIVRSNIRNSAIIQKIAEEKFQNTAEELAFNISRLYLNALMIKEQITVLQQSMTRNEKALQDSRFLFLMGKNLKTDTLSQYIAVQNLKASIADLYRNLTIIQMDMSRLMGWEGNAILILTDSLTTPLSTHLIELSPAVISGANDMRKDVKLRELQAELAKEKIEYIRAQYKPQFTAIAQYQLQSQNDDFNFSNNSVPRTSFVGIRLNIPVFSGHRSRYQSAQSAIEYQQNLLELKDQKIKVENQLKELHAGFNQAMMEWNISKRNVAAAEVNYAMMNERFRLGMSTRLELADAELSLTKAMLNELYSIYTIRMIEVQWQKATGTLQIQ